MNKNNDSTHSRSADKRSSMEVRPYSRLVSLPVHSENVFHFPEGVPAFEHIKEFVFVCKPDTTPFLFMHALDPADISFVCIDPFLICKDYKPRISESDVGFLHLDKPEDVLLLGIVTVHPDMHKTTVNLQGPIAINMQACIGKQIICENQSHPVRYLVWDALENAAKAAQQKEARQAETVHA